MGSSTTEDKVFRILAFMGAILSPFVIWLFTDHLALRTQVSDLKSDNRRMADQIANIPQVIELAMTKAELARMTEKIQKAIETHEQVQSQVKTR